MEREAKKQQQADGLRKVLEALEDLKIQKVLEEQGNQIPGSETQWGYSSGHSQSAGVLLPPPPPPLPLLPLTLPPPPLPRRVLLRLRRRGR